MLPYHTIQQACYNIKNKIIKIVKTQATQKITVKEEYIFNSTTIWSCCLDAGAM